MCQCGSTLDSASQAGFPISGAQLWTNTPQEETPGQNYPDLLLLGMAGPGNRARGVFLQVDGRDEMWG